MSIPWMTVKNGVGIQNEHDYCEQHGDHWT